MRSGKNLHEPFLRRVRGLEFAREARGRLKVDGGLAQRRRGIGG